MWIVTGELLLGGPARGLGVDFVGAGRVSERLARRHFSERERQEYPAALCFATREAVIKAVGGVGIPGAPLRDMELSHDPVSGEPRFVAGARYMPVLERKAVASVALAALSGGPVRASSSAAVVTTRSEARPEGMLAVAVGAPGVGQVTCHVARWAVASTSGRLEDLSSLGEVERRIVCGRADPLPSIANRLAARHAAAALGLVGAFSVRGGGTERPSLWDDGAGETARALLSLGHEGELGVAAVLVSGEPLADGLDAKTARKNDSSR